MEAEKKLGEIIKYFREKKLNMTQKEFSEKLFITTVYVSYLEKAKRPPADELLKQIYALANESVPEEVIAILKEVKLNKKKANLKVSPTDLIYDLKENNIYKYPLMKKKLKENPQDLTLMYGIIRILIDEDKKEEAKKQLFKYLSKVTKPEDKKWLEASYYELEGNIKLAISFLEEALVAINKNQPLNIRSKINYQLASMYFRQGQFSFRENQKKEAISFFTKALNLHEAIRKTYQEPFYQIEYANIFLWLAILNINQKENYENYLKHIKYALLLNHQKGMENASFIKWKGLYNKNFVISSISFMGRAYAHLADFETDLTKKEILLNEGEMLFAMNTPIEISSKDEEYYRFYFNQACFYSIKAKILHLFNKDFNQALNNCTINLKECFFSDSKNDFNLFRNEATSSAGLIFYREKRMNILNDILGVY